jgi:hypothetical protein
MSAYKVVNLMDLENSVGDRAPGMEGRLARKHLESRDLGVSHWRYVPNLRAPAGHRHGELRPWDVVRVAPEVVRAFESGPDGLELIAVGGPRPTEGDGQLADEPWPDES